MPQITIHQDGRNSTVSFKSGDSLLSLLQKHSQTISAPCGGNGSCGKCAVYIKEIGEVNSCKYFPTADIEVLLPTSKESFILTQQYQHTIHLKAQKNELAASCSSPFAIGIDLGTTSVVLYLINLKDGSLVKRVGFGNPQTKYGADVISRINYCTDKDKLFLLQNEIIKAINHHIADLQQSLNLHSNQIVKISIAANTSMLHLLAGKDPSSLALVPFQPVFTEEQVYSARELGLNIKPKANIHLLPSLSAFIGADIMAGLACLSPQKRIKKYLFIDIGTNGEIALVTEDKIYCCATAAGPAFEGANISCGMCAFEGAISSFRAGTYQTISNQKPIGISGSALIDIVAYMLNQNLISMDGNLEKDFIIVPKEESGHGENISINPQDIREVQLAKSAIFTGIKLLLQEAKLSMNDLDAIYLAGGFGNYLNPENAIKIGLLPNNCLDKIIAVGNTSGAGAVLHAKSDQFIQHINAVRKKSELVDLAKHPDFEIEFAMNMYFENQ
jgi:uncharacterized 2Fe-2S/4Fe-4S cluster protein (DUF4445 family)